MFKNCGSKIKDAARILFGIDTGLIVILTLMDAIRNVEVLLVGIVAFLVNWFICLFIYGFGELIVKVTEIA